MWDGGCGRDADTQEDCNRSNSAEAQNPASTNGQEPSSPTRGGQQDLRWLQTLSDPELDLLISLKDLAMAYTDNASLAMLSHDYDLPTMRALGIVLLETLKERLQETSIGPSIFDRLTLLSDSPSIASDSESEGVRSKTQKTPMGVDGNESRSRLGGSARKVERKETGE